MKNEERIAATGGQKHYIISDFDTEIMRLVKDTFHIGEFDWLHPSFMYNLFKFYWRREYAASFIEAHTHYKSFQPISVGEITKNISSQYVAVKFYFSECFPDTSENRSFISNILHTLAKKTHVVLLNTGLNIDDHKECNTEAYERIHKLPDSIHPRNNLEAQTQVVSNAVAFLGTYGGFSYLAPFYGVPSIAFYSREDNFLPVHIDIAYRALRSMKYGSFDKVIKTDNHEHIKGRPEFMAMNVQNFDILQMLSGEH
jgi:hypothetical protein